MYVDEYTCVDVWNFGVCGVLMMIMYYRKRGSAFYIVREVHSVRERERDTERERERERRK